MRAQAQASKRAEGSIRSAGPRAAPTRRASAGTRAGMGRAGPAESHARRPLGQVCGRRLSHRAPLAPRPRIPRRGALPSVPAPPARRPRGRAPLACPAGPEPHADAVCPPASGRAASPRGAPHSGRFIARLAGSSLSGIYMVGCQGPSPETRFSVQCPASET